MKPPSLLLAPLLLIVAVADGASADRRPWIDSSFVLFWRAPVRAHPGVPLDFQFSVYEADNQPLAWSLSHAPAGMTISSEGEVSWTPSFSDTGIRDMGVRATRADGVFRERSFRLTTGTRDFLFVSPEGSDEADGSIDHPLRTLEKAMRSISGSDGKTILAREGVYRETYVWETAGIKAPFGFVHFPESDYLEIRSYPGERAVLDCGPGGGGLGAFGASHVVFSNLVVRNASRGENAGILLGGDSGVAFKVEVHDSHWASANNCTGFKIQGGTGNLIDRSVGHDNRDTANDHWNNTNFLVYNDGDPGIIHVLNSVSWGSNTGFKIKHAGPKKLILHNNRSSGDAIGFGVGSRLSSIRHCVAEENGGGIVLGIADPNSFTNDSVLAEHNTVIDPTGWGIQIQHSYFTGGSLLKRNLVAGRRKASGTSEGDHRLFGAWIYDPKASTYPLILDSNLYFAPGEENIIRLGNDDPNFSWTRWRSATPHDAHSIFAAPVFLDSVDGRWIPSSSSAARFPDGTYAGAFAPMNTAANGPRPPPSPATWRSLPASTPVRILTPGGRILWTGTVGEWQSRPGQARIFAPARIVWSDPVSGMRTSWILSL
ncbi:MAG: right-handed parallel beta-helix repeat-containing protein [Fibrobacteria bacterium]|nr:right-handed parallel beta-helix repeat-containing protein [Fibrobacteria bacterium]